MNSARRIKPVGFVYTEDYNAYNFGEGHPLTPLRIEVTYELMKAYNLLEHPNLHKISPKPATEEQVLRIHTQDYLNKLKELNSLTRPSYKAFPEFGLGPGDNPIFPGMYDAALSVCGASIAGADYILKENHNRAFNITGGLHHAMPGMASGFCILNDVAVAIQYLLDNSPPKTKIMYLDIDCHHGDGVQWIFYENPQVLTLSFHQDGHTIFPGTGHLNENGKGNGKYYALNVPFLPGTFDRPYIETFERIVSGVMKAYRPDYLVMQCGMDTHFMDPLTNAGLSTEGQEKIFKIVNSLVPDYSGDKLLALGGGGYNIGVVARSWTMILANLLGVQIDDPLPTDWLKFLESKWDDSPTHLPFQLRDRNFYIEERQLKDPFWVDSIEAHLDVIVQKFEDEYIPAIRENPRN
ncbi:MAG: acetoin utilization protein AcuC [Promethearchaeota archaeon]